MKRRVVIYMLASRIMDIIVHKLSPACGKIQVSGDKSISHRALLISAIADGMTEIYGLSQGKDCMSTLACLRHLGVDIEYSKNCITVNGKGIHGLHEPVDVLDCGNSGTTMRLLTGLLSGQDFTSVLTGDRSLRHRPMKRVIEPITLMSGTILSRKGGVAPLTIQGHRLKAIEYTLPVASAQVKSALIFAGMLAQGTTIIRECIKTRDHTERMLAAFNGSVTCNEQHIEVTPDPHMVGQKMHVPGDISSAAFFIILASILPESNLVIQQVGVNPTRTGIIDALQSMGAQISLLNVREENNEPIADIHVGCCSLCAPDIGGDCIPRLIDELPIIAVAATQAHGMSRISGAGELRIKETDRIHAIVTGLQRMGADIHEQKDGFVIHGPCDLHGGVCSSYHDHRIAMALTIAGLVATGETVIQDAECIDISFPEFIPLLNKVCGEDTIRISK